MAFITASFLHDVFLIFAAFLVFSYLKFILWSKNHWKRLNIPYVEPSFIFGNTWKAIFVESASVTLKKIYLDNSDKPLLGVWSLTKPFLLVNDVDLIKNMLVKDFQHFHDRGDRGLPIDEKVDPLQGKNNQ